MAVKIFQRDKEGSVPEAPATVPGQIGNLRIKQRLSITRNISQLMNADWVVHYSLLIYIEINCSIIFVAVFKFRCEKEKIDPEKRLAEEVPHDLEFRLKTRQIFFDDVRGGREGVPLSEVLLIGDIVDLLEFGGITQENKSECLRARSRPHVFLIRLNFVSVAAS